MTEPVEIEHRDPARGRAGPGPETDGESGSPFSAMDPEMAANPQPVFKVLREASPVMPIDGVGVLLTGRAEIDEAFRHPELFSSNMSAVDLGNIRPLIPLQIDPPEHKKYRKILDPIFAPKQMALLEEPVTQLVNDLIDRFVERDEIDFAADFSVPFPSLVFLTLLGLPLDELPTLRGHEGRHHPARPGDGVRRGTAPRWWPTSGRRRPRSTSTSRACSTSARPSGATTSSACSSTARSTATG